jgi:hypothetical protein
MVEPLILRAGILVGAGIVTALFLIIIGFWLGRKSMGESTFTMPSLFSPNEKRPEMDLFERAALPPEEGGFTDEELAEMNRARPYEGL